MSTIEKFTTSEELKSIMSPARATITAAFLVIMLSPEKPFQKHINLQKTAAEL